MMAALLHVDGYRPYDDHILFMKAPTLLEPESDASHVQNQLGDGDEKGGTVSVSVCVCVCSFAGDAGFGLGLGFRRFGLGFRV